MAIIETIKMEDSGGDIDDDIDGCDVDGGDDVNGDDNRDNDGNGDDDDAW